MHGARAVLASLGARSATLPNVAGQGARVRERTSVLAPQMRTPSWRYGRMRRRAMQSTGVTGSGVWRRAQVAWPRAWASARASYRADLVSIVNAAWGADGEMVDVAATWALEVVLNRPSLTLEASEGASDGTFALGADRPLLCGPPDLRGHRGGGDRAGAEDELEVSPTRNCREREKHRDHGRGGSSGSVTPRDPGGALAWAPP